MSAHHYCQLDDRRLRYYRDREKTLSPLRAGMRSLLADLAALDWTAADAFDARPLVDMAPDCEAAFARLPETLRRIDFAESHPPAR